MLRRWWLGLGVLAALGWLLALAGAALAAPAGTGVWDTLPQAATPVAPVTDNDVNAVAKQLYCPVCENIPLDVCPTVACAQWRGTIREKLEEGWSEQQILDYFAAQYGERVLARPPARGLGLLIWIIPPVVVLAGALGLWGYLRGQTRAAPPPAPPAPSTDEYAQRLEEQLRERR